MLAMMMEMEGEEIILEVGRDTIQEGRSFSEEAMEELNDQILAWIGSRVMRRWDATSEPPSVLRVEMKVTVG